VAWGGLERSPDKLGGRDPGPKKGTEPHAEKRGDEGNLFCLEIYEKGIYQKRTEAKKKQAIIFGRTQTQMWGRMPQLLTSLWKGKMAGAKGSSMAEEKKKSTSTDGKRKRAKIISTWDEKHVQKQRSKRSHCAP